jgi:thymidylate synthase ThyX
MKIKKPYGEKDPYASVELIASTGLHSEKYKIDQMPVLSARVSHAQSGKTGDNSEADKKLMNYLAKNLHMTPFEHQSATFKIVLPLFVAREWMRHRTQAYNEVSMRYSSDPVGKFYIPQIWRQNYWKKAFAENKRVRLFLLATIPNFMQRQICATGPVFTSYELRQMRSGKSDSTLGVLVNF